MSNTQISWSNFTWWITDKLEGWPEWSYYDWYNIDTRWFYARSNSTHNLLWTYSSTIRWIYEAWKHSNAWSLSTIVWVDNWWIYLNWTLVNSISTSWQKQWSQIGYIDEYWKVYLYMFPFWWNSVIKKVHKIATSWVINTENYFTYVLWWGRFIWSYSWSVSYVIWDVVEYSWTYYKAKTNNTWVIPTNWVNRIDLSDYTDAVLEQSIYCDWARILFSYNNNLYRIDDWICYDVFSLPKWENIVWITNSNWYFRIYTNYNWVDSYIYTMTESQLLEWWYELENTFKWYSINWVIDSWAYDYFTSNWSLYSYPASNIEDWEIFRQINLSLLWKVWHYLYLNYTNKSNKYCLATFWKKVWFDNSLEASNWLLAPVFNKNCFDYNSNYIVYSDWVNLYSNTPTSNSITWYIESLEFRWTKEFYKKVIENAIIRFRWANDNCLIKVEAMINNNWTWITMYQWKNSDSSTDNFWVKLTSNNFEIWEFNTIRLKVSWIWTLWNTFKFYWIDLLIKEDIWV